MALYKAYGFLSKAGVRRSAFLLDLLGTTPVAVHDGSTVPDLDVIMSLSHPTDGGATGTGIGVWVAPKPGHDLKNLDITVVILPTLDAQVLEATTAPAGDQNLIVVEFHNGDQAVTSLIA